MSGTADGTHARLVGDLEYVPELLPPDLDPPERPRQIPFTHALLTHWLVPGRHGSQLCAAPLSLALGAHALAVLFVVAAVVIPELWPRFEAARDAGDLRALGIALREAVIHWASHSGRGANPWTLPLIIVFGLPMLQVVILGLSAAAVPWCAAGDSPRSVWKRSLGNAYWASTIIAPASLAWAVLEWWNPEPADGVERWVAGSMFAGLVGLGVFLMLRCILVGAGSYVGQAVGPAFEPRRPRCEDCGYALVGLPVGTDCPECGLPVDESLVGGRRRPVTRQTNAWRPGGLWTLLRLHLNVLYRPEILRRIPVRSRLATARRFWWGTYLITTVGMIAAVVVAASTQPFNTVDPATWPLITVLLLPLPILLQAATMFIACLWGQLRHEIRDYRTSSIVCYYASPLAWPLMILVFAAAVLFLAPISTTFDPTDGANPIAYRLRLPGRWVAILFVLAMLACLRLWWARVNWGLRKARYANV